MSEDQIKMIQKALFESSSYNEEEEMMIGMFEDIIEEGDEEISHGLCY